MKTESSSKPVALSLVIPLYNEAEGIKELAKRLIKLRPKLPAQTEILFINDGSSDLTATELAAIKLPFQKVVITLSRNFGHQAALVAGLQHARGEIVITLDGDLQHPPELIPEMLAQHQKGIDIVLTKRFTTSSISPFKQFTAHWFYKVMNSVSQTPVPENMSDFRSLNRRALAALLGLPEKRQFIRGMVQWIGFSSIVLPFEVEPRFQGQSKYSLSKMLMLALHGLTSFSTLPLYLAGLFSFCLFLSAVFYALYVIYIRFFTGTAVSGWASVLFVTLVIGGFLSFFLGVIGLYLAAVYDEVKQRPMYIIKEKLD